MGIKLRNTGILTALVLLFSVYSCNKPIDDGIQAGISIKTTETEAAAANQWVSVKAEGAWTLSLSSDDLEQGETLEWVTLKEMSGTGSKNVLMSWSKNDTDYTRSCVITLSTGGAEYTCEFIQKGKTTSGSSAINTGSFKSDPVADWMELPAMEEADNMFYVTHDMSIAGKPVRNYEFFFDTDAKLAHWVAYPLNKALAGSGSRSNAWGIDPKVPTDFQAILYSGFRGGYDRGHQLPSADRYTANASTFYGTNMTPQRGELNQNAWASLEGMVRSWANSFDTLYVVTGADIRGSSEYALDNVGKKVTVPVGYYKALLGYRKGGTFGITASTGGYTAIGFYFEHKGYTDNTSSIMAQSMTIDELEEKMGMDFFVNLPKATSKADEVESTKDSWWK